MCCTVDSIGRKKFDAFLRSEMNSNNVRCPIPKDGTIYDYKFDLEKGSWILWKESVKDYIYNSKLSYSELIIPTKDSICYTYLLNSLILNGKHLIMTGPTGTGKSINITGHLQNNLSDKYVPIMLTFSAQTSANVTQDMIDTKCEKRRKGVFGPTAGKEFVIFVDDINMPTKEEYGAQPPIEILRQWFDNGGWYDRKTLEMRKITGKNDLNLLYNFSSILSFLPSLVTLFLFLYILNRFFIYFHFNFYLLDVIFVCACGPPGGGRNHVTARFYRHFNIINYVAMSDESLCLIFSTILSNFLSTFDSSVSAEVTGIVKATVSVYNTILTDLRPTPAKPHYTFNMRDISKVFQGLLMCEKKKVTTPVLLSRIWINESSRVFGDRLINNEDKQWLKNTLENNLELYSNVKSIDLWEERPEVICADFMVPGSDPRIYEEVNVPDLQCTIEEYLGEYNAESKQPMLLVIFDDAMLHVVKISRILRQPSGHALLLGVGGSGRQSLTRLASYISGYKLYQIEISKGYGMNEWKENLKECLLLSGIQNRPIVFLFNDIQIINETMLEDINSILNSGDVPNLYSTEDFDLITHTCKPDCVRKKIAPTKMNIFSQYVNRVKSNIHVVMCMSPLGSKFRTRLRKFPSLVNCCTIDWFMEWPDDALQSVAARFLSSSSLELSTDIEEKLIKFFQFIHQSIEREAVEFLQAMKRKFYVTPTSYLELLGTYGKVLKEKRIVVGTLRDRLKIGVEKLESTENAVNELQATLTEMEPKLIETQKDVEILIIKITKDKVSESQLIFK